MSDGDHSRNTQLAELAQRHGIELEYTDAGGERCQVLADTLRAVLRALGVDASSDAAIRSAIEQEDRQAWVRALPPVQVVREGRDEPAVEIVVPEELTDCHWYLEIEGGRELEGQVAFSELPLIERREIDGVRMQRRRLLISGTLPHGYHLFRIEGATSTCRLVICPAQCWLAAPGEEEPRLWGVAAQLYLVHSANNWGFGDFTDLRELMRSAPERDIDIVGVNPLHALFPDQPERASPYSPSSRALLNVLYLDVTAIEGFGEAPAVRSLVQRPDFQKNLFACQASDLVRYERVAALKWPVLRLLFANAAEDRSSSGWREFEAFCSERGEPLRLGCLFQALREHLSRLDRSRADWSQWPPEFQDPASTTVVAFAEAQADEITFLQWLQWQADRQLAQASAAADGMRVGLSRDLAVGTDPAGAECWSNQDLILSGVHIGAPPDPFHANGQDWRLAPFHPRKLKEERYEHFIGLLRANMRYAGALRIEHAMSLERLFWIPAGASAHEGAYVRYPLRDLLGIVALESERHHCIVIGEDLGTVRPEFREQMHDTGILSHRVLFFERAADGRFLPADAYPKLALAVAGSHDLPTLCGWWEGRDVQHDPKKLKQRALDRRRLLDVLELRNRDVERVTVEEFIAAVHLFLRKTPSVLAMAQLDDLDQQPDPVNVPGTSGEYPNWRRRLSRA